MGSVQSLLTPQNLIAAVVLLAAIITVWRNSANVNDVSAIETNDKAVSKKGKKKGPAGGLENTSNVTGEKEKSRVPTSIERDNSLSERPIPGAIPESGAGAPPPSAPKKEKKRKGKKSGTPVPSGGASEASTPVAGPSRPPTGSGPSNTQQTAKLPSVPTQPPATEAWTRVESRRKTSVANATTSDAGVTTATSVEEDGSSSGVMEKTGEEETQSKKTLAERVLPKGRKTAVDDMLESSHYPELSRVMRVAPAANEKPATGFSWGDYEDVEDVKGADADGEDDGGWGVVKSRGKAKHNQSSSNVTSAPQPKAPETLTKKQRQNAAKRAAEKAAKAEGEAARQALLAKHKRDLERDRIAEQHKTKRDVSGGGMTGSVNSDR